LFGYYYMTRPTYVYLIFWLFGSNQEAILRVHAISSDAFNHTSVKVVFQPHIIFTHMCPGLIKEHFVCQVWLHQHLHNIFKEAVWLDVIIFDVLYAS